MVILTFPQDQGRAELESSGWGDAVGADAASIPTKGRRLWPFVGTSVPTIRCADRIDASGIDG